MNRLAGGRVVASVEARMGSTRLPGKVLADVAGLPALSRLITRLRAARLVDAIVVATSTSPDDDAIADWGGREGVAVFRGSEHDVLARVVAAQESMGADVVVEITGDCPLLDPEVVDLGVATFMGNDCDVVTNTWQPSYPQGVDVQVFPLELLADVSRTVPDPPVREHVSLHFYRHPERYRIVHVFAPSSLRGADLRFQLDYAEDLALIRAVYERLEPVHGPVFGVGAVLELLRREPELAAINAHCLEKAVE